MDAKAIVYVVLGLTAGLLLVVVAPWRLRRDALDEHDLYTALSGEPPGPVPDDEPRG